MSSNSPTTADAAADLTAALHRIGDALVRVDSDALRAVEVDVSRAMTNLAAGRDAGDRQCALDALRQAQAALLRCRRLGASLSTVSRALLRAGAATTDGYSRAGGYLDRAFIHSSMRITA
jgi:hypothetical protein